MAVAARRAVWSSAGVSTIWLPQATEPPMLEGRRVRLRATRDDDAHGLFGVFSDPDTMRYWSTTPVADIEQIRERIRLVRDWFAAREGLQWAIALRDDDRCIGTATLFNISLANQRAEFGCSLARMLWGQGLAREAVGLMLRFGFDHLHLERIEADIDPRNAQSIGLAERLGFQREGLLRGRWRVGGEVQDSLMFGLLREEFRA
jgi:ribosomal-protein-alanine N-acetyltransferase